MLEYGGGFYNKLIGAFKVMNFPFFQVTLFEFNHNLECQGLKQFVMLRYGCFEDMMKVFYANLHITDDGTLCSKANRKRIIVGPSYWVALAKLRYQRMKVNVANPFDD